MPNLSLLEDQEIEATVRAALDEDIGSGDLTASLVPSRQASAKLVCRDDAVICGRPWFDKCFELFDHATRVDWLVEEGDRVSANTVICQLEGNARSLLTVERTALNFLQTLSAVSTTTQHYVQAVSGTGCRILDTRKTIPGLRKAEKYAVSCGGGYNHRIGLYDAILIKENHIAAAGSICEALRQAAGIRQDVTMIEIEVETIDQLQEAINCGARRVLLDNFPPGHLETAIALAGNRVETEYSGNVTLENVGEIAQYGINYVSIGALTKNIQAIDLSLLFT